MTPAPVSTAIGEGISTTWVPPRRPVGSAAAAQNDEVPKRISTHVFRCVQELLNNVAKHAQAKTAWIKLKREGMLLSLEVRDDGVGMADETPNPARLHGAGIRNLRERAEMTGGQFSISSVHGGGTSVQIQWQLGADEPACDAI